MSGTQEPTDLALSKQTREEVIYDTMAAVTTLVPLLGGAISNVLSGQAGDRRFERVRGVILQVAARLENLEEEQAEYLRSEDFEDLLTETLQRVSAERSEEKRRIYAAFLAGAIESPGEPYDEQRRFLRTMEELEPDELRVLGAMMMTPDVDPSGFSAGSRLASLRGRLPDIGDERLQDLFGHLVQLRIAEGSLGGILSGAGAKDLRPLITRFGDRFTVFLSDEE